MYIPNGIVRRCFFPGEEQGELPDFVGGFNADKSKKQKRKQNAPGIYPLELTKTMQPLKDHTKDVTLITGLDRTFKNGQDVHAQGASCYLTSLSPVQAAEQGIKHPNGRSLDQVIGDKVGHTTAFNRLRSVVTGSRPARSQSTLTIFHGMGRTRLLHPFAIRVSYMIGCLQKIAFDRMFPRSRI